MGVPESSLICPRTREHLPRLALLAQRVVGARFSILSLVPTAAVRVRSRAVIPIWKTSHCSDGGGSQHKVDASPTGGTSGDGFGRIANSGSFAFQDTPTAGVSAAESAESPSSGADVISAPFATRPKSSSK